MRKTLISLALASTIATGISACSNETGSDAKSETSNTAAAKTEQSNSAEKTVTSFYEQGFVNKDLAGATNTYVSDTEYIQHNPGVDNGKEAFLAALTDYVADPALSVRVARIIADDNLVVVHAEWKHGDTATAVADIFRVENDKIVEHWDVQQEIPAKTDSGEPMV